MLLAAIFALLLGSALPVSAAPTEADLYNEAESRYLGGTWAAALSSYDTFLATYPQSGLAADARLRRAVCLLRLERWDEASRALAEVKARWKTTRWIDYVPFWQGVALYHLGSWSLAVVSFDEFLARTKDPEITPQALLHRALAQVSLQDASGAVGSLRTLVTDWPKAPEVPYATVLLGTLLARAGSWKEVASVVSVDASAFPDPWREQALSLRAEALWETGGRSEAATLSADLVRSADDEVARAAYQRLFTAAEQADDFAGMQALVQRAEARFAASPEVLAELWTRTGVASHRRGNRELADYFLSRVWALRDRVPVGEIVPLYLADIKVGNHDVAGARTILQAFLDSRGVGTGAVILNLGTVDLEAGDFSAAADCFARYLEQFPDGKRRDEALYFLAYSRYRQGRLAEASDLAARSAASPGPYAKELGRLRIALLTGAGKTSEALAAVEQLAATYPADARLRLDRMRLLFRLGKVGELPAAADALFAAVPGLAGSDPYAWLLATYLKGLGQVSRKEWRAAIASLEAISRPAAEAAGLGAIVPYAWYYIGWSAVRAGSMDRAASSLDALVAAFPSHELAPRAWYLSGWAQFSMQAWDQAASRFGQAAKSKDPDLSSRSLFLRAKSVQNAGRLPEAAAGFKSIAEATPPTSLSDDALLEYASIEDSLGAARLAADAFDRLTRQFPDSPFSERAMYSRADTLLRAGLAADAQLAFAAYRRAWPRGSYLDASWYGSGQAALKAGEATAAVLAWEQLIAGFPASPLRPAAMKEAADAYAASRDLSHALVLYDKLVADYPAEAAVWRADIKAEEIRLQLSGTGEREAELLARMKRENAAGRREATVELARLYVLSGGSKVEDGYKLALGVAAEKEPVSAARALMVVGEYWYRKGNLDQAAKQFLDAAATGAADEEIAASAIYRAAEMVHLAGRPEDLVELVHRLEARYPSSSWTARAKKLMEARP